MCCFTTLEEAAICNVICAHAQVIVLMLLLHMNMHKLCI